MDLVWRKSPTGSASGFCSATIELWPKTDTATVTTVIVDGRETGAAITGIPTTAPTNYDVRMRRLNPYGYGSWTPTITVEVQ